MRVLVTGINGFSGRYLLKYLTESCNLSLFGLIRGRKPHISDKFQPVYADLNNRAILTNVMAEVHPDIVIHLAGRTHGNLSEMLDANVIGTENLIQSILQNELNSKILIIGSSAEYGYQGSYPISEDSPVHPVSNYGISKAAQTSLSLQYHMKENLQICIIRPFNLIGPGQLPIFVCGNIIQQIVEKKKGKIEKIVLKGSNSKRDFIDIRDAVRAYWMIASSPKFQSQCSGQIFNIGTGRSNSVQDLIRSMEELLGSPINPIYDNSIPDSIPEQISDSSKIYRVTGWKNIIPLKTSLKDMYEFELNIVQ